MLLEPDRTPYDLNFSLFGLPVRVHPMFWLFSAILGWGTLAAGFEYLVVWVACVFVSILVHELGHAVTARSFGVRRPHIVLYAFGGLAVNVGGLASRTQRVLVTLAGPFAGFGLFAAVCLAAMFVPSLSPGRIMGVDSFGPPTSSRLVADAVTNLLFINLFWGILNLMPVFPLDGGQVSREAFGAMAGERNGDVYAFGLSTGLAALFAVHSLMAANGNPLIRFLPFGSMWTAILFGLLAFESFQLLQAARARQARPWDSYD